MAKNAFITPISDSDLLLQATNLNLFENLVAQINKDFLRANLDFCFDQNISPAQLKEDLFSIISAIIDRQSESLATFLYMVDLPENEIQKIPLDAIPQTLTYLILLREWKKVWYRAYF